MFAKVKNTELVKYPYTVLDLQEENPFTNYGYNPNLIELFPQTEEALNNGYSIVEVEVLPKLIVTRLQKLVQDIPKRQTNGNWQVGWIIQDKTTEEILAEQSLDADNVRATRNKLLENTDWTQLIDSPVNKIAWASYRQALRDITKQNGFPWNITWPNKP